MKGEKPESIETLLSGIETVEENYNTVLEFEREGVFTITHEENLSAPKDKIVLPPVAEMCLNYMCVYILFILPEYFNRWTYWNKSVSLFNSFFIFTALPYYFIISLITLVKDYDDSGNLVGPSEKIPTREKIRTYLNFVLSILLLVLTSYFCYLLLSPRLSFLSSTISALTDSCTGLGTHTRDFTEIISQLSSGESYLFTGLSAIIVLAGISILLALHFDAKWYEDEETGFLKISSLAFLCSLVSSIFPCILWIISLLRKIGPCSLLESTWKRFIWSLFLPSEFFFVPLAYILYTLALYSLGRFVMDNVLHPLGEISMISAFGADIITKSSTRRDWKTPLKKNWPMIILFLVFIFLFLPSRFLSTMYAPRFPDSGFTHDSTKNMAMVNTTNILSLGN